MNKKIINQILVLTSCNILTYSLFFVYRIFISRQIGPVGMGLYTFGITMYYLFYNISSGGILTSVSKNIAESYSEIEMAKKLVFAITRVIFLWSLMITAAFLILNPLFCKYVFNAPYLIKSIYSLVLCILIVSQSSILKGFFYGLQKPAAPALAEVFENIVRLSVTIPLFIIIGHMSLETKMILSFFGILIGEISSYLFLLFYYHTITKNIAINLNLSHIGKIIKDIFKISIPLATIGVLGMIFQSLENIIIPKLFIYIGMDVQKAISYFGIINGMSFPAATLPLVVINSLATIIIPTISEIRHSDLTLSKRINNFINLTVVISLPMSCIFMLFSEQICEMIYKNKLAGAYLRHIAPAIIFYYLSVTLSSILNALSEVMFNFKQNTIISILRLIFYVLFIIAFKNELWYIWITNIFAFITCIIMIEKITCIKSNIQLDKTIIKKIALLSIACIVYILILFCLNIKEYKSFCILFLLLYFATAFFLDQKWRQKQ